MSRYIDADRIDWRLILPRAVTFAEEHMWYRARKLIDKQPTADVVEVVRCKDCKFYQDNNGGYPNPECKWIDGETPNVDDFCSFAERGGIKMFEYGMEVYDYGTNLMVILKEKLTDYDEGWNFWIAERTEGAGYIIVNEDDLRREEEKIEV